MQAARFIAAPYRVVWLLGLATPCFAQTATLTATMKEGGYDASLP